MADRFFRFIAAVGMILLGTQTLLMCANADTPFTVVTDFTVAVWSFGLAYWWMFFAKQEYK